ncbi:MAG TPA: hypothetical protein PK954_10425 [Anaerolineales bacterium]|nr:hypothetical protein [Anaerolineales bacterium]HRF46116.1 hypothetical protein [Anaerolineales bacterium]
MQSKRLILWIVSALFGAAMTVAIVYVGFATTPERFAYSNVLLLFLSFGAIAFIWLDYFLKTDYLKR